MKGNSMNFCRFKKYYSLIIITFITLNTSVNLYAGNNIEIITNGNVKYLSNTVIIKLKETPLAKLNGSVELSTGLTDLLNHFNLESVKSLGPAKNSGESSGLDRIIMARYSSDTDPYFVSSKLKNLPDVEWAEPKFVYELDYTPNDPSLGTQWNLAKINAELAWDITRGDTNVVIGIVDTGVDWDHPDLQANIWINWNEIPNNGQDDDENGYTDDVRGWDFGGLHGDPDNDPMEDRPDHGTHVAGISSAVTNNGVGIASIGFSSKIMAVKTSIDDYRDTGGRVYIVFGFEGIRYAVDNGAKVINCSWGGSGYSIFGQETIDYAISKGALVVCSAGNDNSSEPHYPSSYKGVLCVASTTFGDLISGFSNYGTDVDVSAPGEVIYSTWMNDTYKTLQGTSMASPLVAGLAALVFAQFPDYTPLQVGEQVRVNSDNIDTLNPSYINQIGYGRINAYSTLSNVNSISVRAVDFTFTDEVPEDDGDGMFEPGETISLAVNFINYLGPVSNLQITLQSENDYSSIVGGYFTAGAHSTLQEFNNNPNKFSFRLNDSIPPNTNLKFLLHFSDGSYTDYQWTNIVGNPSYGTQSGNNIAMTITSKGTFAYNNYPEITQGDGFTYLGGKSLLYEGALILGTSDTQISDAARGNDPDIQNNDFAVYEPFSLTTHGSIADIQGFSIINDDNAGGNKIGIKAYLRSYTFTSVPDENYIILDYKLVNTSGAGINNLYVGLFFDWDFANADSDYTEWDNNRNFGYAFKEGGNPNTYVGVGLISSEDFGFWAIKNDGDNGGFQIYDGFDDSEKWQAISSGLGKTTAGPGDISNVVSGGPFTIPAGDTLRVAFVVMAGDDQAALETTIERARNKYGEIITSVNDNSITTPVKFSLEQNYPNPFNPTTKIKYSIPAAGVSAMKFVQLKIYDILGNEVAVLINEFKPAGTYEVEFNGNGLSSGVYFYKLQADNFVDTKKMVLIK